MSTTPNQKDLLAKKSDLEGILKPDDNDVLHLPNVTITLAESGQFYLAGIDKKLLTLIGNTSGNAVTLDGDAGLTFTTSGGSSTITGITSSSGNSTSLAASQSMVSAKQDALTAGTNITISNNTISATDTNTLSDLTDTAISSLADGQVLKYNATSGKWVNGTGGGGAEVILGTTAPTAAQGSNGNLYIQYDDTNNNTVTHEYVKISGAWEEIAIGGGGGSTTTVSVTPKVLTGINIADITVGNGNTTDIYDYAYFNGSGYYETSFKVDTDHEYEITFEANYDTTMAIIGTYAGANYFHLTIYSNYWYVGTNSGEVHPSAYTTGKHTFKTDSSHTYLDDTQFTSYTPAVINNYITIGARENTYLYKGKFYEFKIKSISTGNVLYDLVPGMRGTTKGLYDLISDTFVECSFITNMGTKTGTSGGVTTQLYAPSIEANPSGTATDSLSSIEIDGTIYSIEGGGGSSNYTETTLFTGGTTSTTTFKLSDNITNYDAINFIYKNEDASEQYAISNVFLSSYLHSLVNDTREILVGSNDAWYYYLRVTADDEFTYVKSNAGYISDIIGIKFGSSGSGGGGNPELEETALLTTPITAAGTYTLLDNIENYDFVSFVSGVSNEADIRLLAVSDMLNMLDDNLVINCAGTNGRWFNVTALSGTSITITKASETIIHSIMGYKIKGGGGGASAIKLTQAEYDALTQEEKENGTIYFVGATTPVEQLIPRVTAADKTHITCSNEASGYPDWAAFNGIDSGGRRNPLSNTTWLAGDSETTPWIQYHFDEPYYLTKAELHIYSHYSSSGNGYQGNLYILGSNDGSTWTNISITGQPVTIDTGPSATSDSGSGLATVVQFDYDLNSSNQYEYIRFQGDEIWNKWGVISVDFDNIYVYGSSTPIVVEDRDIYYMGDKYTNNSGGGASSHTYSTSEQVVGTWIDGRDMYEKTYYNATGPSQNHPITLDSNITTSNTDYFVCPQYSYLVGGSYINGGSFLEVGLGSDGITVDSNNAPYGLGTITELYTTVRYVKSQPRNVSLLHFEGDLTDECGIGWHINGGPAISTEEAKFGSSSLKFSDGFVYSDITPAFKFGNNDFTIDAWLYPLAATRQAFFAIAPYNGGDYRLGIDMWQQGSSANQWMSSTGSGWNVTNADGGGNGIGHIALSTNTWQHIALVRHETSFTLYINGQVAVTNNIGTAGVYWGSSDVFKLGTWGNNRYNYYGYIDEFRVANYAVWTDTFTPPTQPYT